MRRALMLIWLCCLISCGAWCVDARADTVGMFGDTWLGFEPPSYDQQAAQGFFGCGGSGQQVELPAASLESIEFFVYGDESDEWGSIDVVPGSAYLYGAVYSESGERVALTEGMSIASMGETSDFHTLFFPDPVEVPAGTYAIVGADIDPAHDGYFYGNKLWPGNDSYSEEGSNRAALYDGCVEEDGSLEGQLPESGHWQIAGWGTAGMILTFTPLEVEPPPTVSNGIEGWFLLGALLLSFSVIFWAEA